jgi:hypothetical protein
MSFYEDYSPSGETRLSIPCEPRKPSRCFRTTADGRIPLTGDWADLLSCAGTLGRVAIQTRHAYARLVAFREVPAFSACPKDGYLQAADGSLRFYFRSDHRAWGRLSECECCGTPGRLEIHNEHASEFFQLCPVPGCPPAAWADFLATAARDSGPVHPESIARSVAGSFPRLPPCSRLISNDGEDVVPLLRALGDAGVPLRCLLRTEEAVHSRGFATPHVDVTSGVLTAGERGARFQIGLPAVRALVLSDSATGWTLHFSGPDDTSLLTLTAPAEAASQELWRMALRKAFPQIG